MFLNCWVYVPVAAVENAADALFGQLLTEESWAHKGFYGGAAHAGRVLLPHREPRIRPLHIHQEATVG